MTIESSTKPSVALPRGEALITSRPQRARAWLASNAHWLLAVGGIYLATRAAYAVVTAFAYLMLPEASETALVHHRVVNGFIEMQWRWDAVHYFAIARNGYGTKPGGLTAFFPLFPQLVHGLAVGLGWLLPLTWDQALLVAGPLVSAIAGLIALPTLYRLVALDDDEATAERSVLYLSIFPFSFFFLVPYAEAILLATSVGCFLALRRRHWLVAGLCGFGAVLSKQLGLLLLVPFAWELLLALREHRATQERRALLAELARGAAGMALIPLGLGLYMWYQRSITGDALAFMHTQIDWDRHFILPTEAIWEGLRYALHRSLNPTPAMWGSSLLHAATACGCLVLAAAMSRRMRVSYTLYTIATLLVVLSSGMGAPRILHTVGRQVIHLFPLFILLARWGRWRQFHLAYVLGSAMLFALLAALYVRWYPVS